MDPSLVKHDKCADLLVVSNKSNCCLLLLKAESVQTKNISDNMCCPLDNCKVQQAWWRLVCQFQRAQDLRLMGKASPRWYHYNSVAKGHPIQKGPKKCELFEELEDSPRANEPKLLWLDYRSCPSRDQELWCNFDGWTNSKLPIQWFCLKVSKYLNKRLYWCQTCWYFNER